MSKAITVDDQIIHGVDRFGTWRIHSLEGWKETPPEKTNSEARALADGDYDAEVFYGSRLVTVNGRLSAKSPEMAFTASERLSGLLRIPALFSVDQFGMMRSGLARRGRIAPGQIKGRHLPFQMELRFIDPYKYGEIQSFTVASDNEVFVFHRGTVPAWPKLTITGNLPGGYEVGLVDRLIQVTRPLTAGQTHTIDTRAGILRSNGALIAGGLGITELFRVKPGLPQSLLFMPRTTGSGTLKVEVTDTFI